MAVVAVLAWLPGCLSPLIPPEQSVRVRHGVVRADEASVAALHAPVLDEAWETIHATLPDVLDREVDVRIEPVLDRFPWGRMPLSVAGYAEPDTGCVWLRADRMAASPSEARHLLTHEVVHVLLGPGWEPLPEIVEDGMCDELGNLVAGATEARFLSLLYVSLPGSKLQLEGSRGPLSLGLELEFLPKDSPTIDPAEELAAERDPEDRPPAAVLLGGFVAHRIVERQGLDALYRLAREAAARRQERVPAAALLDAAGLPADSDGLRAAVGAAIDAGDLRRLLDASQEDLARPAAALLGALAALGGSTEILGDWSGLDLLGQFEAADLRLGVPGSAEKLRLADLPRLRERLGQLGAAGSPTAGVPAD